MEVIFLYNYVYDGSFSGFLTCLYRAFHGDKKPSRIIRKKEYQPSLFAEEIEISSDEEIAERVQQGIREKLPKKCYDEIYHAYLSELKNIELCIYDYLRLGFILEDKIRDNWEDESVKKVKEAAGKVRSEAHRFKGLLRFREIDDNSFYGPFRPDYNITGLIAPHFADRLSTESGIIHDRDRDIAAAFSQGKWELLDSSSIPTPDRDDYAAGEENYQQLWRSFFDAIAIEERKNPELQQSLMPKKYWEFLVEKQTSRFQK